MRSCRGRGEKATIGVGMKWLLGLLSCTIAAAAGLSCLSETGEPVDSWVIVKAPRATDYLYAEPGYPLQPSSEVSLNETARGALAYTTQQLWTPGTSYFIYNDEDPTNQTYSFSYGHLKGYGALDETTGTAFWVQHSVPKFLRGPAVASSYEGLLSNAWENAQHMLCVSLPLSAFDAIVPPLTLTRARLYDIHVTEGLRAAYPTVADWIGGVVSTAAVCQTRTTHTAGGMELVVFEKSTQWGGALWDSCIAPYFGRELRVQSWLQGTPIGANCSGIEPVVDVESVAFSPAFSWTNADDHSKWGVADDGSVVCFGDINRVVTQTARGGGAVCTRDKDYAAAFAAAHVTTDTC
jgi:deoxyribonuclease-2